MGYVLCADRTRTSRQIKQSRAPRRRDLEGNYKGEVREESTARGWTGQKQFELVHQS